MEKIKQTKVLHLNLPLDARLIFMSDIHGDITLFKKALEEAALTEKDYLFVLGDMIEKGDEGDNQAMLDFILELDKQKNVYFMSGNCDEIFRFILPPVDKQKFLYYAMDLKKSILNDMAKSIDVPISQDMDIDAFVERIRKKYPQYFSFIDQLPDVIFINDELVLVHGGIEDINHIPSQAIEVLKYDHFLDQSPQQPRLMLVGHNPTRNYRLDIACVNPIFDFKKNVICLDGGNNVVKGGQINVVILDNLKNLDFRYFSLDHYPKYQMKSDVSYKKPKNLFSISFGKTEVEIREKDLDFYFIQPINTKERLWVHEDFISFQDHKSYCYEGSNLFLNLKKGDMISIIKRAMPYCLIKHEGIIGLIESKYVND